MKSKSIFASLILCLYVLVAEAQDTITTTKKMLIYGKVAEVGTSEIKYKKPDNLDGPSYTILKTEVFTIKYQNGTLETYTKLVERSPYNYQHKEFNIGLNPDLKISNKASKYLVRSTVYRSLSLMSMGLGSAITIPPIFSYNSGYNNIAVPALAITFSSAFHETNARSQKNYGKIVDKTNILLWL